MFKKLKKKIKNWTKKVSEESKDVEETKESKEETQEEAPKQKEVEKEKPSKNKKSKEEKKAEREKNRKEKQRKKQEKKAEKAKKETKKEPSKTKESLKKNKKIKTSDEEIDLKLKEEVSKEKYKEPEKKFNAGLQAYESNLDKESEKKGFFKKLKSKRENQRFPVFHQTQGLSRKKEISEKDFEKYSEDLEMILLENNVALEVSEKIINDLKEKIINEKISKKQLEEEINKALKETIKEILVDPLDIIENIKNREDKNNPYVILFCGINGTGKTTSIAKISKYLEKNNISSVLAAGDTFRAASIEQLKKHGEALNKKVISGPYESDPASIGFEAIKYAKKNNINVVLIDTAGRMHTAKNLMAQIEKINRVCNPDLKLFVGESTTGNDILEQVKAFNDSLGIDGIILSKADIDEKGGTALSVGYVTGKPILYLGTGQEYKDLEPFDKEKFVEKLFSE